MARHIPYVPQMSTSDCGYACLSMAIAWHGGSASLRELREQGGEPRGGVHASDLVELAEQRGLAASAYEFGSDAWSGIPRGSILHLDRRHFVVFDRLRTGGFDVVDPAGGRRWLSADELERSFAGVVITTEPTSEFRRGTQRSTRFARYATILRRSWPRLALVMLASIALVGISIALPLATGLIIDRVIPASDASLLNVIAAGAAAVLLIQLGVSWLRGRLLVRLQTSLDREMTNGFMSHLLALPSAFFLTRGTGDLVQRLRSNTQVREMLTSSAVTAVLDGLLASAYLIALFAVNVTMGTLALAIGSVSIALFAIIRRRRRELSSRYLHAVSQTASFEVGLLDGVETIKAAGAEGNTLHRWNENFVEVLEAGRSQGNHNASVDAWQSTLRTATPLLLILFGTHQVLSGALTLGTMLALCALAAGFLTQLSSLVATASRWPVLVSHIDRLADVLDAQPERSDGERIDRPAGGLALRDVTFSYSPRVQPILRNANLDVPAGSFVAVVGGSGAGKSTLARLLAALYVPQQGTVSIDGRDVSEINLTSLRQHLGVVTQDAHLLPLSIRENIALAQPLPIERIVEAAKLAEIHDDILRLPLGYETRLEGGARGLSGGQRQRIALARAIVTDPAILVLDEATSALDPAIERVIHAKLADLSCTRVVISHRLSTIKHADLIAVLRDGEIVETGTHAELLAQAGEYTRLLGVAESKAVRLAAVAPREQTA